MLQNTMTVQYPSHVIVFCIFHNIHTMIHICGQITFQIISFLDSFKRLYKQQKGKFKQKLQSNLFEINISGRKFLVGTDKVVWS